MATTRPRCSAPRPIVGDFAVGGITMNVSNAGAACRDVATHRIVTPARISFRCDTHRDVDVPAGAVVVAITEMEMTR